VRQYQPPPGQADYPHWQSTQYPPQSETNSWNPQSFPSQQLRHPLFDLPPEQPQTPKRNARKRWPVAALIAVVMVAVFTGVMFIHGLQLVSTPRSITRTTHPAGQPMQASTSQEIPQPTSRSIPAPAIVGSDIGAFVAMYGQPNNHSVPSSGYYHFRRYASSDLDFLIVQADAADGGVYAQRVKGVMAQAPGAGWNQQEASAACDVFLPHDAVYEHTVELANGYAKVYFSASLAGLFRASAFTDPNGNQVKAGLFDVQYIYRSKTIIDSCGFLIGTEQTQL
jgi:hypothetical protein